MANGLPLQFNSQARDIRVNMAAGVGGLSLTADALNGSSQGLCYRFSEPGIKKLKITGTRNGRPVSQEVAYEITNDQTNSNWCPDVDKNSFDELQPGDLVFLKNTYGNWADGVFTHVGIYTGNGNYIDRPTMSGPVKTRSIARHLFAGGTRVYDSWCNSAVKIYD